MVQPILIPAQSWPLANWPVTTGCQGSKLIKGKLMKDFWKKLLPTRCEKFWIGLINVYKSKYSRENCAFKPINIPDGLWRTHRTKNLASAGWPTLKNEKSPKTSRKILFIPTLLKLLQHVLSVSRRTLLLFKQNI